MSYPLPEERHLLCQIIFVLRLAAALAIGEFSQATLVNLASKYNRYPINGYGYASAQFLFGGYQGDDAASGLQTAYSTAMSAYDCCVTAMQQANSTFFFFTSNPSPFLFGSPNTNGQNCYVVYNSQCPVSYLSLLRSKLRLICENANRFLRLRL